MSAEQEFKRYNDLVSGVRALRRTGKLHARAEAELIDELEVLEMHADTASIRTSCARSLREFRAPAAGATAARG